MRYQWTEVLANLLKQRLEETKMEGGNPMLDFMLTETQKEWRDKARKFVDEYIIPVASEYDQEAKFPTEVIQKAHETGLYDFVVPKEFGGPGLDAVTVSIVCEELARGCVAMEMNIGGNGLASYPVLYGGTDEQKKVYYDHLLKGNPTAFALTEPGAGSDAGAVATTAVLDGDEYVLTAQNALFQQVDMPQS